MGQSAAFGLHSLAQVREHQPWAAALGYSRKALYADAAAMCLGGADGVLQKPQGADEAAIAKASHQAAPELAKAAFAAVDRRLAAWPGLVGLRLCQDGVSLPLVEALQATVGQFNGREKRSPRGRREALEKLKAVRLEDLELDQRRHGGDFGALGLAKSRKLKIIQGLALTRPPAIAKFYLAVSSKRDGGKWA